MITYQGGTFGFVILFRLHGSAVLKAVIPAVISTMVLVVMTQAANRPIQDNVEKRYIQHPYAVGALIAFFTFLITFRANFAYNRYWEACTAVHQMISKWVDAGMFMAAFHYQCNQYDDISPPSFGKHPELRNLTRERERHNRLSREELNDQIDAFLASERDSSNSSGLAKMIRIHSKKIKHIRKTSEDVLTKNFNALAAAADVAIPVPSRYRTTAAASTTQSKAAPKRGLTRLEARPNLSGGIKTPYPSLFLQDGVHLLSLLSAVAMSSLRDDIEGSESPLVEYIPGSPWPPVDPDQLSSDVRGQYRGSSRILTAIYFLFGRTRSAKNRTLYNYARPFGVLGGVSDAEIKLLQKARGPEAKTALVTMWLQEYISREYLAGSTGGVAPPIISRLYHCVSDGLLGYNQARKVAYIPFPYPHAQLTAMFIFVIMAFFPFLMYGYVNELAFACILNFLTVLCFVGLHEVARELENPFRNVPNDIPLSTYQAQFNEALIVMYAGFHPDSWWEAPKGPIDSGEKVFFQSRDGEEEKSKVG